MTGPRRVARIGIDLGGTKIEGRLLDVDGNEAARHRVPAPRDDYAATLAAIADVVAHLEAGLPEPARVGVAMPGSLSPMTGRVQNSNSTWLNGKPLDHDLAAALGRSVRFANDANCFALSEATDGAAAGAASVFGVIIGTGCGGGIVIGGRVLNGPRGIGGEWGHNPLPWALPDEYPGPLCWCGRRGCMEMWASGTGLAADHERVTGERLTGEEVAQRARAGDAAAEAALARHASRLARGIASVVNIVDPEVIVLGGGLSQLEHLYRVLPALIAERVFADRPTIDLRRPKWGDASGGRGAAWLWSTEGD